MKAIIPGLILVALMSLGISDLHAQVDDRRCEAGFQLSSLRLREIGESPVGVGGRFGYRATSQVAVELLMDYFPENPSGNFGETQLLMGFLAGKSFEDFGVFAKARAGFIHFGGSFFDYRLSDRNHPAFDLGGVFDYFVSRRFSLRVEAGDTIIAYGDATYPSWGPLPARMGTVHNLELRVGLGIRF